MSRINDQRDSYRREDDGVHKAAPSDAMTANEGKVFPPTSDVEVPRMPAKADTTSRASQPTDETANRPVDGKVSPPVGKANPSGGRGARQAADGVVDQPAGQAAVPHAAPPLDQAEPKTPRVATPGDASPPAKIDTTESNWADSTQPAPDKRTARSSIL